MATAETLTSPAGPGTAGTVPKPQRSMMIDIVRGIAISLMAMGHTNQGMIHRGWWGQSNLGLRLDLYVYAFHMPVFFFVTGIFLYSSIEKRGSRGFVVEKLRTILYPYLLTMCTLEPIAIAGRFTVSSPPDWKTYALSVLTGAASWFLPTIFFMAILAMLLRRIPTPILFVLSVIVGLLWRDIGVTFVDRGIAEFPFMVAGIWAGRSVERVELLPHWLAAVGALALAVLMGLLTRHPYGSYLFYPLGLLGTLMMLLIATVLGRSFAGRWAAWAGFASISIFLFAPYFQWFGRMIVLKGFHTTAAIPQLLIPTTLAVLVPAWVYHERKKLRLGWVFVCPFPRSGKP